MTTALAVRDFSKSFGGQLALDGVSFDLRAGEIVALVGENGSGKSTLVKILAGFHVPGTGSSLSLNEVPVPLPVSSGHFRQLGLSFVFQDLGLALGLSVVENLFVGRRTVAERRSVEPIHWREERRRAAEVFTRYALNIAPDAVVGELRPTEQALLAIARAAEDLRAFRGSSSSGSGVLVLDEPTVFLPETEKGFLLDLVRRVAAQGTAVLFVSHDLTSVRGLCSRALVLRDGRLVGDVELASTSDDDLVRLIAPSALKHETASARTTSREADAEGLGVALRVENLRGPRLNGVDFEIVRGEVLGVAGLLGSGSESLPYAIFGALPGVEGLLRTDRFTGEVASLSPRRAINAGFALVPADRQRQGAAGSLSVEKNLLSLVFGSYWHRGVLSYPKMRKAATERSATYRVRLQSPGQDMVSLSGGNQQKVVLAKWLERQPAVLLLHEPTQGVDVATRTEIYRIVEDLARNGTAVLWVTTDFDELAAVSDRILIVDGGVVTSELTGGRFTHDEITSAVYASSTARTSR
jgi:ribose transport system ATP-binding protein